MKKRYILSVVGGVIGATATGYFLANKQAEKNNSVLGQTFEDAGIPGQTDNKDLAQFENAKMVSEGSQFGVNYYNEIKERINKKENNK